MRPRVVSGLQGEELREQRGVQQNLPQSVEGEGLGWIAPRRLLKEQQHEGIQVHLPLHSHFDLLVRNGALHIGTVGIPVESQQGI